MAEASTCAMCPLPRKVEWPHPVTFLDGCPWVSQHKGEEAACALEGGAAGGAWPGLLEPSRLMGPSYSTLRVTQRSVAWPQLAGRGQVEGEQK